MCIESKVWRCGESGKEEGLGRRWVETHALRRRVSNVPNTTPGVGGTRIK